MVQGFAVCVYGGADCGNNYKSNADDGYRYICVCVIQILPFKNFNNAKQFWSNIIDTYAFSHDYATSDQF